jgi:hypothetical protein
MGYLQIATNIREYLNILNNLTPTLHFTIQEEYENKISFLDVTISLVDNNIMFIVYRRPTVNDTIIPNDSCHSSEHKLAAIKYINNRASNIL